MIKPIFLTSPDTWQRWVPANGWTGTGCFQLHWLQAGWFRVPKPPSVPPALGPALCNRHLACPSSPSPSSGRPSRRRCTAWHPCSPWPQPGCIMPCWYLSALKASVSQGDGLWWRAPMMAMWGYLPSKKIVVVFIYLHSICFRVAEEFINTHYTHITHHSTPAASSLTVFFTQTSR